MNITTLYDVDQKVFIINNNKIIKVTIASINIVTNATKTIIKYTFREKDFENNTIQDKQEYEVYDSKEKIIENL